MTILSSVKKHKILILELVITAVTVYLANIVNTSNKKDYWEFIDRDIHYEYKHGIDMISGINPYDKVLQYDLLTNHKYATLFPLYYYYIGGLAKSANYNLDMFLDIYRFQLFVAEIFAGLFLYMIFRREGQRLLGLLASSFFVFNRWTIANLIDGKQDVIAIMFLMVFFYLFKSKSKKDQILSFIFFGLSVGFKHIGIFIAPILFIPLINKQLNIKEFIYGAILFTIPTLVIGMSAIIKSPLGFFYSMLFSFTREPSTLNTEFGYKNLLILYDVGVKNNNIFYYLLPRLPLVIFTLFNTLLLWYKKIPVFVYSFTSLFIFIAFNPVLFSQYLTWVSPLIFLSVLEFKKPDSKVNSH